MKQAKHAESPDPFAQTLGEAAGWPPLIAEESEDAYERMLGHVIDALAPADMLEHVLIRDVVDLSWKVLRLRRLEAGLMAAGRFDAMRQLYVSRWGHDYDREAPPRDRKDPLKQVDAELAKANLTASHVAAYTFAGRIHEFESIERMTAAAETRRDAALCRLDRHRASLALRLRRALLELEHDGRALAAPQAPAGNLTHDQPSQDRGQPAQRPA